MEPGSVRAATYVLVTALAAMVACSDEPSGSGPDDGGGGTDMTETYCDSGTASDAMALCLSFTSLYDGSNISDVGGFDLELAGGAEIVEGRVGAAVRFNGTNGEILVDSFSFDGDALTVEAWVYPEGPQEGWATIADYWYEGDGFWLGTAQSTQGWEFWSNTDYAAEPYGLAQDAWQHVAGVMDQSDASLTLYVNGVAMDRVEGISTFAQPTNPALRIGGMGFLSDYFAGLIDEVMVWTEVRTADEICADAHGTWDGFSCSFSEPVGMPPGPCGDIADDLAWWVSDYASWLPAGLEDEIDAFVAEYVPGNPAFDGDAETYTALGMTGTMYNSQEVACWAFLNAALEDPDNPVTLNNAATCMFFLDRSEYAFRFLECSLYLEPQNGSAIANMATYEYTYEGNLEAALDLYEQAKAADPLNPEWAYQAMQVALELGDTDTASDMLADLPAPSGASNGYRGVGTGDGSSTGSFCCPCDPPTTYSNISDCTAACTTSMSCFVGICAFNADCGGDPGLPLSFGIKLCYPPSGAQICITMDTSGSVGFLVGVSVLNGFLGVGTGFSYNVINGHVNFVVDVGTNTLPINTGATYTYDITAGTGQAAVGLSNSSNTSAGQVTVLTH